MTKPLLKPIVTWRDRAPKEVPGARCCWVCGRLGGAGFTSALRWAGYRLKHNEMAIAHPRCLVDAQRQHTEHVLGKCAERVLGKWGKP